MKKYQVVGNSRIYADTDDFIYALNIYRKLDKAGFNPKILDKFGIIKE